MTDYVAFAEPPAQRRDTDLPSGAAQEARKLMRSSLVTRALVVAVVAAATIGVPSAARADVPAPTATIDAAPTATIPDDIPLTVTLSDQLYDIWLVDVIDADSGTVLRTCYGPGISSCNTAAGTTWDDNADPPTRHFYAQVRSATGVISRSATAVVQEVAGSYHPVFTLPQPPQPGDPVRRSVGDEETLSVDPGRDLSPNTLRITDDATGAVLRTCTSPVRQCTTSVTLGDWDHDIDPPSVSFTATVTSRTGLVLGQKGWGAKMWPTLLGVHLDFSNSTNSAGDVTGALVSATATPYLPPGWWLTYYSDDGSIMRQCNYLPCRWSVETGIPFDVVATHDGRIYGESGWQSLQANGDVSSIDTHGLNVAAIAEEFPTVEDLCTDLAAADDEPRLFTPGPLATTCAEEQAKGRTVQQILLKLATTTAGAEALEWILAAHTSDGQLHHPPPPPPVAPPTTATPPPTATARQLEIDETVDAWLGLNPKTDLDSPAAAREMAKWCMEQADYSGYDTENCRHRGLPILIQGRDIPDSADNEIAGLTAQPLWFVLDRRDASAKEVWPPWDPDNKPWYYDQDNYSGGCVQGSPRQLELADPACDEFPFWSTMQAEGGPLQTSVTPAIRWTSGLEASTQGALLSPRFYPRCGITETPAEDSTPAPGSTFLTFAMPDPGTSGLPRVDSIALCNDGIH